jgi:hypothetical protein
MMQQLRAVVLNPETRQVNAAISAALLVHETAARAAESYGEDVKRMIAHRPEYWDALGLIRLYARIAVRCATIAREEWPLANLVCLVCDRGYDVDDSTATNPLDYCCTFCERRAKGTL